MATNFLKSLTFSNIVKVIQSFVSRLLPLYESSSAEVQAIDRCLALNIQLVSKVNLKIWEHVFVSVHMVGNPDTAGILLCILTNIIKELSAVS